jgi:hypothetical protein
VLPEQLSSTQEEEQQEQAWSNSMMLDVIDIEFSFSLPLYLSLAFF